MTIAENNKLYYSNTAQRCGIPTKEIAELLLSQQHLMTMRAVTDQERSKAMQITTEGHP